MGVSKSDGEATDFAKSTVSWIAMIVGYAQNGFSEKALETFKQMQLLGVKPNFAIFSGILPACATMGALEEDLHKLDRLEKKEEHISEKMGDKETNEKKQGEDEDAEEEAEDEEEDFGDDDHNQVSK